MSKRQHKQLKDYSWDQSDKFVKVYLTNLPGLATLNKENIQLEFTDQSLSVRVEDLGGKDLSFAIKQTAYPIDPASRCQKKRFTYMTELTPILVPSHYKVKSDYLLIFMAKAKQGNKWSHITHAEKVLMMNHHSSLLTHYDSTCRWRLIPRVKPWTPSLTRRRTPARA